ncbi:macro domain-containing protein [Chondrinema litorale]|uniref:macro domain-containing protein n=1 Tax=Chondrinema litorale TaxID=2994555 RepID=UPI0025433C2E|nr:macro domain-containing protein [Chondrinema litorale]UZR98029.1 macro domain-containing protein [Chondrinema litorale]
MKTVKGDLVSLALQNEFDVIIHGCNCFCTMGAGIAKLIKQEFPEAYKADLETQKGDKEKLGSISFADKLVNNKRLIIVNAYTQYHWRGNGQKADYEAIKSCFKKIKEQYSGLSIAYPAIGAGLAGGDWKVITRIIEEELAGENHTFVEFSK